MFNNSRFAALFLFLKVFLAFSFITRTVLVVCALPNLEHSLPLFFKIYLAGLFYDTVTYFYFVLPIAAVVTLLPDRVFNSRIFRALSFAGYFIMVSALVFDVFSEYIFFDEFSTRYNFIAVDYMIYTTEVVRNIRESYPLIPIFAVIFAAGGAITYMTRKSYASAFRNKSSLVDRLKIGAVFAMAPALSFLLIDGSLTAVSPNNYAVELAGNGIYELATAFVNNELDYDKFYATKDPKEVFSILHVLLAEKNTKFVSGDPFDLERVVVNPGPEKKLNVVVVVEESLSAEYMKRFGGREGLTPCLDELAGKSLLFTDFYATGTRTVRGLEAVNLSIPPLPGTSIIKRPGNEGIFSWGALMRGKGYETKFIYAGHGYFDNMNYFFGHNGFDIVDRTDFAKDEVTFSNAWGVCDEDLFRKVVSEGRKSYKSGKPFLHVIMTTSNHRPYTYPDGKIDIPSKSGRNGSVKYSDYAIGYLVRQAEKEPWFKDTLFVIVADHCAGSARKVALPVKKYEIPLLIYSPGHVKPAEVDTLASQIDIAPTVMGLLNLGYRTKFFGRDVLKADGQGRAFISTYQKMGYMKDGRLVVLDPKKRVEEFAYSRADGAVTPVSPDALTGEMISYTQGVNYIYKHRLDRLP